MSEEAVACSFLDTPNLILSTSPTIIFLCLGNFLSLPGGLNPSNPSKSCRILTCVVSCRCWVNWSSHAGGVHVGRAGKRYS